MGIGQFGGDGSVKWIVEGDNVRQSTHAHLPPTLHKPKAHRQEGIDETSRGEQFTVVIKLPKNKTARAKFVQSLTNFLKKPGKAITLRLPIEDKQNGGPNLDQIRVRWPSKT